MSIPTEYVEGQDQGLAEIELADGTKVPLHFPARNIIVTHMEVERTGHRGGRPWTLFKLFATEADGTPIALSLRTFDALEKGRVEVTMDAYVKNGGVEHYTVKAVKRPKKVQVATREPKRPALPEDACPGCVALEERVRKLELRINAALRGLED